MTIDASFFPLTADGSWHPDFSADFAYYSLPMLLTPAIHAWVSARAAGSPCRLAPSPQQEPRHALAAAELLKIPSSAEPIAGRYGLDFSAGASHNASHSAGGVHHNQPNSLPAMHFLAAGAPGSHLVSRLYSMGPTPFSTPPMPKKALFAESP